MKKSGLFLALSALAGALLVGGTFAAWAVTDNANPFSINITADPTDVEIPEEKTVTLAWGETKELEAIAGMKKGDEKGPFAVGLMATTSDTTAYTGVLSAVLETEATTEAKLIDYLTVKVYDNNTKEGQALLTANKASSYAGEAEITVTSAEEKVVYFYVSLAAEIEDEVWNIINDNTVTLTVDWNKKLEAPVQLTGFYVVGTFNEWTAAAEYKMDKIDDNHYQLKDLELAKDAELKVRNPELDDDHGYYSSQSYAGDAVVAENGNIKVTEAGTYTVNYWVDGQNDNFVELKKQAAEQPQQPEDPEEEFVYFVVGTFNNWTPSNEYGMTKIADNQYQLTDLVLEANAELKVRNPELDDDHGYYSSQSYAGDASVAANGNILVTSAGTYTVTYYVDGQNNNFVVLTKQA